MCSGMCMGMSICKSKSMSIRMLSLQPHRSLASKLRYARRSEMGEATPNFFSPLPPNLTVTTLDSYGGGRSKVDMECNARSRALAMALHPRLGADSPAQVLSADLMRHVAHFARLVSTPVLMKIEARTGTLVDRLEFWFSDGSLEIYGGDGGSPRQTFWLRPGEYIEGICGRTGDALDQVQFRTNTGRRSPMYGGYGGQPFFFSCLSFGGTEWQQREILNLKWASGQCGRWLGPRFQAVLRQPLVSCTHTGAAAYKEDMAYLHPDWMGSLEAAQ